MEKLGIQPFNLLAQVINFLILFFLLSKFLYQPILKMLDERRARIKASLEKEKEIAKTLAQLEEMRLAKKEDARKEAQAIISQAKEIIEKEKREVKEKVGDTIREAKEQAREEFKKEKEALIAQFREQIAELVLLTTKQVLKASLGKEEQKKINQNVLKEIKELKPIA